MVPKINFLLLCCAFVGVAGCKSSQLKNTTLPQTGLFKVVILYPGGTGKTFDMDYYENKHMPMMAGFLGQNLQFYEIDKGISGRTGKDEAPFVAVGYFYIKNVAEYNQAIAQNRDVVVNDLKHYTNIQPVVQINEVRQVIRGVVNRN